MNRCFAAAVLIAMLGGVGCWREDNTPPPTTYRPVTNQAPALVHGTMPAIAATNPAPTRTDLTGGATPYNAEKLESDYLQAADLRGKVSVLDDFEDAEPHAAVAALGRLFYFEKNDALREEILHQLVYIDGAAAAKTALLGEAVQPAQPQVIRLAAIDVMVDEGDVSAIGILQRYVSDGDNAVREAAVDAIEELQTGD